MAEAVADCTAIIIMLLNPTTIVPKFEEVMSEILIAKIIIFFQTTEFDKEHGR